MEPLNREETKICILQITRYLSDGFYNIDESFVNLFSVTVEYGTTNA